MSVANKTIEDYKKDVESGNLKAMFTIAQIYKKNSEFNLALEWYKKSAESGFVLALCYVGLLYEQQYKDINKAKKWYKKGILLGDKASMYNLGNLYHETDYKKAIKWYTKAANAGCISAMNNLGYVYTFTLAVKDLNKARKCYKTVIKLGDIDNSMVAMYNLGCLYQNQLNNMTKALKWYNKSADLDFDRALYVCSSFYMDNEKYEIAITYLQKLKIKHNYAYNCDKLIQICLDNIAKSKILSKIYNDIHVDNCVCCLETLLNTNNCIITLLCGHSFHYKCIQKCDNCPVCRSVMKL